jgi:hypothetical protein
MKKKTINKAINTKFDHFLSSITDEEVRKLVKENSIITGGCIASMLLKEPVNDYDLYFTNKETTKAVALYYVGKFKEIAKLKHKGGMDIEMKVMDGDEPVTHESGPQSFQEPGRIKIYIKSSGIAGEKQDGDYQYFESRPADEGEDYVQSVVDSVTEMDETKINEKSEEKYRPVFVSANAITLSDKIQIVIRFYGDPDNIHQHYDYIHCTNYWTSKDRAVTLKQPALEALMARELVYVGSKYPLCSIIRTRKFIKRGFTINAGQYLKMAFQVSKLDLTDIHVLEDQLIGVDAAYFGQLVDSLKATIEKKKEAKEEFVLDYGYLASIIDKIF